MHLEFIDMKNVEEKIHSQEEDGDKFTFMDDFLDNTLHYQSAVHYVLSRGRRYQQSKYLKVLVIKKLQDERSLQEQEDDKHTFKLYDE